MCMQADVWVSTTSSMCVSVYVQELCVFVYYLGIFRVGSWLHFLLLWS
jgi:hypothetical protein